MNLRYEAKARLKSVYSIWRKMETKHVPFEEIYDLYAMRIIFDCDDPSQEKGICWSIYSAITDLYRLHPDRTRDWVSIPKANGYQALHLTVMGPDGNWVEVQIRSRRMDEIAEKGLPPTGNTRAARATRRASSTSGCAQSRTYSTIRTPTP